MNTTTRIASLALGFSGALCAQQDTGRVLSATPVIQQIGVPRQVCSTEPVAVQAPRSGAGALMGAIAGGAIGNAVGGPGAGQAAATMLGLMGGAILGDRIEGAPPAELQNVQRCSRQTFYENRTVAYNVVYEFGGKQYSVQMPNDPGQTIRLQITPVGAMTQENVQSGAYSPTQPVYAEPPQVTASPPMVVQSGYYVQPYVQPYAPVYVQPFAQPYNYPSYRPPIALSFRLGHPGWNRGEHRERSHRHWR